MMLVASIDAQDPAALPGFSSNPSGLEDDARQAFYNAQYESAAALTLDACNGDPSGPSACELRTSALLFQIQRAMGEGKDRKTAWKRCADCPALLAAFDATLARGQETARARLRLSPQDDDALFLLGKLDLNYVWLQLGALGHRTGWNEYREARQSLDAVLSRQPGHVRARVARGWIDYIVATKVRWGARWLLGGGDKKQGLLAIREAAAAEADFFTRAEARFALWDMQIRERDVAGAVISARALSRDFPVNPELRRFLDQQDPLDGQRAKLK
jgi:hypothetical protein